MRKFRNGLLTVASAMLLAQLGGGMSDTLKEAAGTGVSTAADEAAKGATMESATKKGTAAAVDSALGVPTPPAEAVQGMEPPSEGEIVEPAADPAIE